MGIETWTRFSIAKPKISGIYRRRDFNMPRVKGFDTMVSSTSSETSKQKLHALWHVLAAYYINCGEHDLVPLQPFDATWQAASAALDRGLYFFDILTWMLENTEDELPVTIEDLFAWIADPECGTVPLAPIDAWPPSIPVGVWGCRVDPEFAQTGSASLAAALLAERISQELAVSPTHP